MACSKFYESKGLLPWVTIGSSIAGTFKWNIQRSHIIGKVQQDSFVFHSYPKLLDLYQHFFHTVTLLWTSIITFSVDSAALICVGSTRYRECWNLTFCLRLLYYYIELKLLCKRWFFFMKPYKKSDGIFFFRKPSFMKFSIDQAFWKSLIIKSVFTEQEIGFQRAIGANIHF